MATSGDKTWGITRNDIIDGALRKLGEYDTGESPPASEYNDASQALNAIIKEWRGEGVGLWLRQRTILILNRGVQRYKLGPSGTTGTVDDFHAFADTELAENTIDADEAAGQTILSIEDDDWVDYAGNAATKPTSGNIGIRLDDLSIHWTTITGVGADTVTVNDALPSAASEGARVYTYTTRTSRPTGVLYASRQSTSGADAEIDLIGRKEYERLSLKDASGVPVKVHFDPQLTDAVLFVWPVQNGISYDKLILVTEHYPDDFDAANNDPEFPAEWANALIWNLADDLADEYTLPDWKMRRIEMKAAQKKYTLLNTSDLENASMGLSRELHGRG